LLRGISAPSAAGRCRCRIIALCRHMLHGVARCLQCAATGAPSAAARSGAGGCDACSRVGAAAAAAEGGRATEEDGADSGRRSNAAPSADIGGFLLRLGMRGLCTVAGSPVRVQGWQQ
jgi:hypothetical protein